MFVDEVQAFLRDPKRPEAAAELAEWCVQNALWEGSSGPTALGRALDRLRGRDAVEFLLAIGVELSVGPGDAWRASAGLLNQLLESTLDYRLYPYDQPEYPFGTVARLADLGVARRFQADPDVYGEAFALVPEARDLVTRVLDPDSRFRALVRTLLDVERGAVARDVAGVSGSDGGDLDYARSVAHEVRNLILPLSTAMDRLWAELGNETPDLDARSALRTRIDRALGRLNEFATEAAKISAAVAADWFRLAEIAEEAVRATEVDRNGRIGVHLAPLDGIEVEGSRGAWTLVLVNLLRNAAQVRAGTGTVWISTFTDDAGGLHLCVDDDGPGVPEELRQRVFEMGLSTHGGSGLGLWDARRTAQRAGDTLVCEASPHGGARFHFTLRTWRRT
jgi:signal transduction histidine kinase